MSKDFTLRDCLHEHLALRTVLNLKDNELF